MNKALAGLIIAGLVLDVVMTLIAFRRSGFTEVNPIMRPLMQAIGAAPALIVTHGALAGFVVYYHARASFNELVCAALLIWAVGVWNIFQLARHR